MDALGGARRGTAQAGHAARRAVFSVGEPVDAAEPLRIGPALLGVRDRVHAVTNAVEHGVVALAEDHFFRVAEEVAHRDTEAAGDFRYVRLNGQGRASAGA